jgi:hypothetical protein
MVPHYYLCDQIALNQRLRACSLGLDYTLYCVDEHCTLQHVTLLILLVYTMSCSSLTAMLVPSIDNPGRTFFFLGHSLWYPSCALLTAPLNNQNRTLTKCMFGIKYRNGIVQNHSVSP